VNLALLKKEKVTTGGKSRGEVGKITGMATDAPSMDRLDKGMEQLVDGGW
jgi:hypothetical protein